MDTIGDRLLVYRRK